MPPPAGLGLTVTDLQGLSYIVIRTPIGVAIIDPAAPPTPMASTLMNMLGISVEVGVGTVPPDVAGAPSLATTLPLLTLGVIAFAYYLGRKQRGS